MENKLACRVIEPEIMCPTPHCILTINHISPCSAIVQEGCTTIIEYINTDNIDEWMQQMVSDKKRVLSRFK